MPWPSRAQPGTALAAGGERRPARRAERPRRGRSPAPSRAAADSRAHTRSKARRLAGQGLVSTRHRLEELSLSAKRICSPSTDRKPILISPPTVTSSLQEPSNLGQDQNRPAGLPPTRRDRAIPFVPVLPVAAVLPGLDRRGACCPPGA